MATQKKNLGSTLTIAGLLLFPTMTMPIFSGYFVSFILFIWMLVSGWPARTSRVPPDSADFKYYGLVRHTLRPLSVGVVLLLICLGISAIGSNISAATPLPWTKIFGKYIHYFVKYGLMWFVLSGALTVAHMRGMIVDRLVKVVVIWLAILFIYSLCQRYFGIDWAKGFSSSLGDHRFAYGVYRVSGFFGHPLTLAHNAGLLILGMLGFAFVAQNNLDSSASKFWRVCVALVGALLILSASRYPIIVLFGVAVLSTTHWKNLSFSKVFWPIALLTLVLVIEQSMINRVFELFKTSGSFVETIPRFKFWTVHLSVWQDYKIFGVGIPHLDSVVPGYYVEAGYHDKMYTAHNIFLQFLADSGIVGFTGLIALVVGMTITGIRLRRLGQNNFVLWIVLFVCLTGLMQNNLRDSEFIFALWVLIPLTVSNAFRGVLNHYNATATTTSGKPD